MTLTLTLTLTLAVPSRPANQPVRIFVTTQNLIFQTEVSLCTRAW